MKLTEEQIQEISDIYHRISSPIHAQAIESVLLALDIGMEDYEKIIDINS